MEAFRALHAQHDLCLDLFFLHSATVGGKFIFFKKNLQQSLPSAGSSGSPGSVCLQSAALDGASVLPPTE